jgi:hypothetical protein
MVEPLVRVTSPIIYKASGTYLLNTFSRIKDLVNYESRPAYVPYWRNYPVYKYASPIGCERMLYFLSEKVTDT